MTPKSFMSAEEQALKYSRDYKNVIDTAREDGFKIGYKEGIEEAKNEALKIEGKIEGKTEVAINLYNAGVAIEIISQSTDLSIEEIEQIIIKIKKTDD